MGEIVSGRVGWWVLDGLPPRQWVALRRDGVALARFDPAPSGSTPLNPAGPDVVAVLAFCRHPTPAQCSRIADHVRGPDRAPLLLLTDAGEAVSAMLLRAGVADVVPSGVGLFELYARLARRIAERHAPPPPARYAGLTVARDTLEVQFRGQRVPMPRREAAILALLIDRAPLPMTTSALRTALWHQAFDPGTNSVAVHLSRLRARIAAASGGQLAIGSGRAGGYALHADISCADRHGPARDVAAAAEAWR